MKTEARGYDLLDVVAAHTGRNVSQRGIEAVYDISSFIVGEDLMTHQLLDAYPIVKATLEEQHPWLATVEHKLVTLTLEEKGLLHDEKHHREPEEPATDTIVGWIDWIQATFPHQVTVQRSDEVPWEKGKALEQFAARMGDKPVLVVAPERSE